jgi:ABC-type transporter lipoprotein component MlaA
VQLNGTGGLLLSLNSSALPPGSYTVNATMGAYGATEGFAIVQPFIGLEVRAAGANGTELSRATTIYYYYNGSVSTCWQRDAPTATCSTLLPATCRDSIGLRPQGPMRG